jgi:hypothetical protein
LAPKTPDHGVNTLVHDANGNPRSTWNRNERGKDAALAAFRPLTQAISPTLIQFDAMNIDDRADD